MLGLGFLFVDFVLFVGDCDTCEDVPLSLLCLLLEIEGLEIEGLRIEGLGIEGLEKFEAAILVDINVSEMEGLELLKWEVDRTV